MPIDTTKRYWLFCGLQYYPQGGMYDWHSSYDDGEEAMRAGKEYLSSTPWSWAYVWDDVTRYMLTMPRRDA